MLGIGIGVPGARRAGSGVSDPAGLVFNGSSTYLEASGSSSEQPTYATSFTLTAWVKVASYVQGCIVGKGWASTADGETMMYLGPSGQLILNHKDYGVSNGYQATTSASAVPIGRWVHVAAVYTGSGGTAGIYLYVDGVYQKRTFPISNGVGDPTTVGNWTVGAYQAGGGKGVFFNGAIANVEVILGTALTSKQIADMARAGVDSGILYSPTANWRMGDTSETVTVTDRAGSYDAAMNGPLTYATAPDYSPEYNPAELGDAIGIWRGETIVQSAGNVVSWEDASANQNTLAATGTPAYSASDADFNSNPSVAHVAASYLRKAGYTGGTKAQPNTIYLVGTWTSSANAAMVDGGVSSTTRNMVRSVGGVAGIFASTSLNAASAPAPGEKFIARCVFNGGSSGFNIDCETSADITVTGNSGTYGMAGITLLDNYNATAPATGAKIAFAAVFAGDKSASDTDLLNLLAGKY